MVYEVLELSHDFNRYHVMKTECFFICYIVAMGNCLVTSNVNKGMIQFNEVWWIIIMCQTTGVDENISEWFLLTLWGLLWSLHHLLTWFYFKYKFHLMHLVRMVLLRRLIWYLNCWNRIKDSREIPILWFFRHISSAFGGHLDSKWPPF